MNVENSAGAVPGDDGSFELNTFTSLGMPGPDPTMMLSAVDPSICVAVTLTPPRAVGIERLEARQFGRERRLAAVRLPRIGDDLGRVALPGADDQVEDAVAIDVAHGDAGRSLKAREWRDRGDEPVAIAVIHLDLGRVARDPGTATA